MKPDLISALRLRFGERQHVERLPVIRLRPHPPVQPRHGLHVVVEDVRPGLQHARHGIQVAAKIRRQHFHPRLRQRPPHLAHGFGEMARPAVFQIVAVHAGDHHVAQIHVRRHARHVGRLVRVEPHVLLGRIPFRHRAESAAARAVVAQNHERGGAAVEAFMDIGAARRFANRVQVQLPQPALQPVQRFEMRARSCAPIPAAGHAARAHHRRPPVRRSGPAPSLTVSTGRGGTRRFPGRSWLVPGSACPDTAPPARASGCRVPGVSTIGSPLSFRLDAITSRIRLAAPRWPASKTPAPVPAVRRLRRPRRMAPAPPRPQFLRRAGPRRARHSPAAGGAAAAIRRVRRGRSGIGGRRRRPPPAAPVSCAAEGTGTGVAAASSLLDRGEFCPTTYPMANATANSSTTIKKPLSNCRLPTTSSNSPVSLFRMCYVLAPGLPPLA